MEELRIPKLTGRTEDFLISLLECQYWNGQTDLTETVFLSQKPTSRRSVTGIAFLATNTNNPEPLRSNENRPRMALEIRLILFRS